MDQLIVSDCLWRHVVRVLEEERPGHGVAQPLFAVFRESIDNGVFCGLATANDIMQHPDWIFADLTEHRENLSIAPNMDVRRALKIMDRHGVDALPVLEQHLFVGVVTRQSILEMLLQREHLLFMESRKLKKMLDVEHEQIVSWSEKLAKLHEASRSLLSVLAHTSVQNDLLQIGIESLSKLLEAHYGAIGILDESGALKHFVFTGISSEQAQSIGQFPQGKGLLGVVIQENVSIRLDDISKDPHSAGFPAHHPSMKT